MSDSRDSKKLGAALLVTGTDIGVGKTFVAAGLARLLRERGFDVGVMKPIETGWPAENGEWSTDVEALRAASESDDPVEDVMPYCFEDPVAPQVAADRLREPIEMDRIEAALNRLRAKHDVVLVEGAGGIAVPIDDGYDFASLAAQCEMPILVVARAHVGTLNHTFLTVHYARSRGVNVLGVVANRLDRSSNDPSAPTNASMIGRMCDVPVIGVLPFRVDADTMDEVTSTCRECFDLDHVIGALGLSS